MFPSENAYRKATERAQRRFCSGSPDIPGNNLPPLKSAVFPNAGYATLRAPEGDLTEVIKFGPHGGGHGHLDKLGEVIYAYGGLMSVDPGTQFYGVASHATWDKETVAHNTIVVDETSQARATGRLLSWLAEREFTSVMADAGSVYPNLTLRRRIVLTSHYVLEITDVESMDGANHIFDWVYHNSGQQQLSLQMSPWTNFPQRDGYQHLTENRTISTNNSWKDLFEIKSDTRVAVHGMQLWMLGSADTQV